MRAPEKAILILAQEPVIIDGELTLVAEILFWRGRGNVIAAAGTLLLDLLERA